MIFPHYGSKGKRMAERIDFVVNTWEKLRSFYGKSKALYEEHEGKRDEAKIKAERINRLYEALLSGTGREKLPIEDSPVIQNLLRDIDSHNAALRELDERFTSDDKEENEFLSCMLSGDDGALKRLADSGNKRAAYAYLLKKTAEGDISAPELSEGLDKIGKAPDIYGFSEEDYEVLPTAERVLPIIDRYSRLEGTYNGNYISTNSHRADEAGKMIRELRELSASSHNSGVKSYLDTLASGYEGGKSEYENRVTRERGKIREIRTTSTRQRAIAAVILIILFCIFGVGFGSILPTGGDRKTEHKDEYGSDVEYVLYRYLPLPATRAYGFGRVYLGIGDLYCDGVKGGLPVFAPFANKVALYMSGATVSDWLDKKYEGLEKVDIDKEYDEVYLAALDIEEINVEKVPERSFTVRGCSSLKELKIPGFTQKLVLDNCPNLEHLDIESNSSLMQIEIIACPNLVGGDGSIIDGAITRGGKEIKGTLVEWETK